MNPWILFMSDSDVVTTFMQNHGALLSFVAFFIALWSGIDRVRAANQNKRAQAQLETILQHLRAETLAIQTLTGGMTEGFHSFGEKLTQHLADAARQSEAHQREVLEEYKRFFDLVVNGRAVKRRKRTK